jgi:hypothetical protein
MIVTAVNAKKNSGISDSSFKLTLNIEFSIKPQSKKRDI